jgi:hypothetical protein
MMVMIANPLLRDMPLTKDVARLIHSEKLPTDTEKTISCPPGVPVMGAGTVTSC